MKVAIRNLDNQVVGEVSLTEEIYGQAIRSDILHTVVNWQRSRKQQGTHKTKGLSEVSGTGKKPYKQKGTGNARLGTLRAPQCRGGAVIFGPVVRSHETDLPKKVRKLGLKIALSSKLAEKKLIILDRAVLSEPKTALLNLKLKNFEGKSILLIDGKSIDQNFRRAAENLMHIDVLPTMGANVYDILKHDVVILTTEALTALEERLQ
ncbi:MAG: 50S ribosomal protein L4 [Rickettsiales bacterium]